MRKSSSRKKPKNVASRRRGSQLEDAILDAAWSVLTKHGYSGFTYDAIAAKAKTSRPVLYRRWPQREDILFATIKKFWRSQPIMVPDTGNLREDAIGFLRNAEIGRVRMKTLLMAQIFDFFEETGSNFNEIRKLIHRPGEPSPIDTIIARAVERGELRDTTRSPRVLNLLIDLFRHDTLMTMRPMPEDKIVEIVDEVWLPLIRMEPGHRNF